MHSISKGADCVTLKKAKYIVFLLTVGVIVGIAVDYDGLIFENLKVSIVVMSHEGNGTAMTALLHANGTLLDVPQNSNKPYVVPNMVHYI